MSGVSLEEIQACAKRPAGPRRAGSLIAGPPRGRRPPARRGPGRPPFRPRSTRRAPRRRSPERRPVVTRRVRATPSSTTKTDCSWPRSTRAAAGTATTLREPSGKTARPNMPERRFGSRRQIDFHDVGCARPRPPPARFRRRGPAKRRSSASSATSTACPAFTQGKSRFVHRSLQPVGAFAFDGEQRARRARPGCRAPRIAP